MCRPPAHLPACRVRTRNVDDLKRTGIAVNQSEGRAEGKIEGGGTRPHVAVCLHMVLRGTRRHGSRAVIAHNCTATFSFSRVGRAVLR